MKLFGKKDIGSYAGKIGCLNCDYVQVVYIKKGVTTTDYLEKIRPSCGKCGCRETVRMYTEYSATKDLVKEFIMNAHHMESHEEEKEHDHFA